jgi:hypothetical protein
VKSLWNFLKSAAQKSGQLVILFAIAVLFFVITIGSFVLASITGNIVWTYISDCFWFASLTTGAVWVIYALVLDWSEVKLVAHMLRIRRRQR